MSDESNLSWVDKYSPKTLSDMILDPILSDRFGQMIKDKKPMNMTLHGVQGCGKTTLATIFINELGESCEHVFIRCGVDNSVDMVRNKLSDFIDSSYPGRIKIVILDEADSLSGTASGTEGNSAQKALRSVMNTDDVIFILTCNNIGSLSMAIQSRCTPIKLKFDDKAVFARCANILKSEGVSVEKDVLLEFYDSVIKQNIPDIRSIIRQLELWSGGNQFHKVDGITCQKEIDVLADEIIKRLSKGMEPREVSRFYITHEDDFSKNYEQLAMALFRKLYDSPKAQLLLSDSIYRMSHVVDKEIQFYSAIVQMPPMMRQI